VHSSIRDETNLFFTKSLDHARGLAPSGSTDVLMLMNTEMIGIDADVLLGLKLDFVPNHYVKLLAPLQVTANQVRMDYWSFGAQDHKDIALAEFQKHYYGAIIGER
jgi:hypothetical protein